MDESIEKFKTMHRQKKHLVLLLRSEESVIMTIIFQFFKMTKKSNLKRLSFFTIPNSFFCNRAKKFEKTVLSYCHARCHQLWPRSSTTAIINIIEKKYVSSVGTKIDTFLIISIMSIICIYDQGLTYTTPPVYFYDLNFFQPYELIID